MKDFTSLSINDLSVNPVNLIAKDWMLITAGNQSSFNTMTASWGSIGHLWNKPVAFMFIRPQRYTYDFVERNELFSLCFFEDKYRQALNICGTKSGRDTDKVAQAGLTPAFTPNGTPAFQDAKLVFECKKLYNQMLTEDSFVDSSIIGSFYPQKDLHKLYIGEIVSAWTKVV